MGQSYKQRRDFGPTEEGKKPTYQIGIQQRERGKQQVPFEGKTDGRKIKQS